MSSFVFQTTRSIVNGLGSASRAGELVKGLIATNATATGNAVNNAVLVVSDHGVMSAGIGKPLLSSFEEHGMDVSIFKDTVADPPDHQVLAATQAARDQGATAIVGFGGGSSMDIAKL
jgi:alcohol dehydrogenase class IV